jgi:hypothetical protein
MRLRTLRIYLSDTIAATKQCGFTMNQTPPSAPLLVEEHEEALRLSSLVGLLRLTQHTKYRALSARASGRGTPH